MREIKFRAYIKASGTIHDVTGLHYMGGSISEIQIFCNSVFMWYHILDVDLMQYTGLKDKNGVEIFEGDIVNLDIDGEFMDGHRLTPDFKDPFIVEEKEGCFECRFIEGEKETFPISEYWQASNDLKVIGNIYENPELLEAKC